MKTTKPLVARVTGGNRGLGLQTARELGSRKITVVLGVRDLSNAESVLAVRRDEGLMLRRFDSIWRTSATHYEAFEETSENRYLLPSRP